MLQRLVHDVMTMKESDWHTSVPTLTPLMPYKPSSLRCGGGAGARQDNATHLDGKEQFLPVERVGHEQFLQAHDHKQ